MSSSVQSPAPDILAHKRVLLVEDEDDCRDLHRRILHACGADVIEVGSVGEALQMLQRFGVDLIVSDIGLPVRDGYALIRAVRSSPATASLPAIALTAFNGDHDRARALTAGFDVHLAKPLDAGELLAAVGTLLNCSSSARP